MLELAAQTKNKTVKDLGVTQIGNLLPIETKVGGLLSIYRRLFSNKHDVHFAVLSWVFIV